MILTLALQDLLGGIYDVRIAHDVYDFLVTDRGDARRRAARSPHATKSSSCAEAGRRWRDCDVVVPRSAAAGAAGSAPIR